MWVFSCEGGSTKDLQNTMSLDSTEFPGPEVLPWVGKMYL